MYSSICVDVMQHPSCPSIQQHLSVLDLQLAYFVCSSVKDLPLSNTTLNSTADGAAAQDALRTLHVSSRTGAAGLAYSRFTKALITHGSALMIAQICDSS